MTTLPPAHQRALRTLAMALHGTPITWVLTGSTSFLLQGVPLVPNDIDVQTDEAGARAIMHQYSSATMDPLHLYTTQFTTSWLGKLSIAGIEVEVIGDIQHMDDTGGWMDAPDLGVLRCFVTWADLQIPVLALSYEVEAYRRMGRMERVAQLNKAMETIRR